MTDLNVWRWWRLICLNMKMWWVWMWKCVNSGYLPDDGPSGSAGWSWMTWVMGTDYGQWHWLWYESWYWYGIWYWSVISDHGIWYWSWCWIWHWSSFWECQWNWQETQNMTMILIMSDMGHGTGSWFDHDTEVVHEHDTDVTSVWTLYRSWLQIKGQRRHMIATLLLIWPRPFEKQKFLNSFWKQKLAMTLKLGFILTWKMHHWQTHLFTVQSIFSPISYHFDIMTNWPFPSAMQARSQQLGTISKLNCFWKYSI